MSKRFSKVLTVLSTAIVTAAVGGLPAESSAWQIPPDAGTRSEQDADALGDGQAKDAAKSLRDDFDEKLALEWKIVRQNDANISLQEHAGELTIFTERGSIHADQDFDKNAQGGRAKNLHVLENPSKGDESWQITTCLVKFAPSANYHQAGLLVYVDDDNYIKCALQYGGLGNGSFLRLAAEDNAAYTRVGGVIDPTQEKVWLRLVRQGTTYIAYTSYDGEKFTEQAKIEWKPEPTHFGLIAKNGGDINAPTIEARFDFFEFEELDAENADNKNTDDKDVSADKR